MTPLERTRKFMQDAKRPSPDDAVWGALLDIARKTERHLWEQEQRGVSLSNAEKEIQDALLELNRILKEKPSSSHAINELFLLPKNVQERLNRDLAEMAKARARSYVESRNYVIY